MPTSLRRLLPAAPPLLVLLAFSTLLAPTPTQAQVRALYWPEFAVEARLDADGRLHVSERQTIQFSGDWNGGERRWDLRPGQEIESLQLTRIDRETGERREMIEGDLDVVDGWDWAGRDTVRWRSRRASDPPFQATVFVYQLDYVMTGVLVPQGEDRYRLDHEFAFADRNGIIGELTVDLSWNPVWRAPVEPPLRERHERLVSGTSPVTSLDLTYTGEGRPAGIPHPLAPILALFPFLFSLAAIAWLWWDFKRREATSGRYEPLPDLAQRPSRDWLDEHVFSRQAEVVGTLWDRAVGAPEVSALLARMVAEGRMESWTSESEKPRAKPVLHLRLLVPREELGTYERELVDGLFFDGGDLTDTEAVREHYKAKGFSPAATIRPELSKVLPDPEPKAAESRLWRRRLTPILVLLVAICVQAATRVFAPAALGLAVPGLLLFFLALGLGLIYALLWRNRVTWPRWSRRWLLAPGLLVLVGLAGLTLMLGVVGAPPSVWVVLIAALLPVIVVSVHLYRARTRETRETVHLRRRLAHAREFFKAELGEEEPDLLDDWYPYLLAFGLTQEVEGWSVRNPSAGSRSTVPGSMASTPSTEGGSSSPSWTGGGGSFGGAGASAAWGSAVAGLSAGVASPSSGGSGGGGGGGGGGGSSGGGGGGGW